MKKKINNFDVMIGDLAITKTSRNKVPFIEVAFTEDDDIRGLFTFQNVQFFAGNIPEGKIGYVAEKVKQNKKFLEV